MRLHTVVHTIYPLPHSQINIAHKLLNLIKKISLTNKLFTITKMLSIIRIQHLTNMLNKKEEMRMKNELFVTAGEVAQELGVSKPFAYKLVKQMNEELEAKGFITIAGRVSRRFYEEKFYGMATAN